MLSVVWESRERSSQITLWVSTCICSLLGEMSAGIKRCAVGHFLEQDFLAFTEFGRHDDFHYRKKVAIFASRFAYLWQTKLSWSSNMLDHFDHGMLIL